MRYLCNKAPMTISMILEVYCMAYFLDDNNPDIIVVLNRECKRPDFEGRTDRIVWSKKEKRYIYGEREEYFVMVPIGEDENGDDIDEEQFDDSIKNQDFRKKCYGRGLTLCGSVFYDKDGKLYEVKDIAKEHELIFDANKLT